MRAQRQGLTPALATRATAAGRRVVSKNIESNGGRGGGGSGGAGEKSGAHRASLWAPPQPGAPSPPIDADYYSLSHFIRRMRNGSSGNMP